MSNLNYSAAPNTPVPRPDFTPGLKPLGHAAATGLFSWADANLSSQTMQEPRVVLFPSGEKAIDAATQEIERDQVAYLLVEEAPCFIQDKAPDAAAIPFKELASLVSTALGLGKSDIARILGVSRPTLYSWIKGSSEPKENDHPDRLRGLGELTLEICRESSRPLYHRFVEEPLPGQTISILALLQAKSWNRPLLCSLLADARHLTMERDRHLGHDVPITVSRSQQENNLLDNSTALDLG